MFNTNYIKHSFKKMSLLSFLRSISSKFCSIVCHNAFRLEAVGQEILNRMEKSFCYIGSVDRLNCFNVSKTAVIIYNAEQIITFSIKHY